MRKNYLLLCLILLSTYLSGQVKSPPSYIIPYLHWNQEKLNWNIAGNEFGQYPNVLSELEWEKLYGPEIGTEAALTVWSKFQVKLDLSYKTTLSGRVTDTDYAGDNRLVTTSELNLESDKGHHIKTRLELSYLAWSNDFWSISPHIGYWASYQKLYMLDGDIPLIPQKKLNSKYSPQLQGITLGVQTYFRHHKWETSLDLTGIYLPYYTAKATWNLREELRQPLSFKHKSKGVGYNSTLRIGYQLARHIQPFVSASYTHIKIKKGTDELFKANGTTHTAQLNEVHSSGLSLGIGVKIFLGSL
ncbi:hypothetical protein VSP10_13715 [Myroides odoratimimus]|uniref:hypothetical protein n=1 Tax=Myroides odoratimimus TaxID=76832 RepID=UPI002DB5EE00|nr:hypothetical protein [Myroides odoratimimus]MEC4053840.1 hypothetical protein [Myroides odoratimimus]